MAEDWDLYAVVRSCAAARANRTAAGTKTEPEVNNLACLASMIFEDGDGGDPFSFPDLEQPKNAFEELNQLCMPFFSAAFESHAPPRKRRRVVEVVAESDEEKRRTAPPVPPLQASPRVRRRKSHQKKVVREVTAENLSSDMWAWRKYGQKPIKGSPYPRCSSSKGCSARKQVEKSTTDPAIFVVTYTGDHVHPRPTHRNSLAGSTRNKLSGAAKPANQDPDDHPNNNNNNNERSSSSAASLSPRTPLSSPATREEDKAGDDDVDDDDLLIPNRVMSEDIFMGLRDLGYGSGFLTPKLEPSWTAADSGSATAGGGC